MSGERLLQTNPGPIRVVPRTAVGVADSQRDVWERQQGFRCDYVDHVAHERHRVLTSRDTATVWNPGDRTAEAYCAKHTRTYLPAAPGDTE